MRNEDIAIGVRVKFDKSYSRRPRSRFNGSLVDGKRHPQSIGSGQGFIVGVRNVIMDNYVYHTSTCSDEYGCDNNWASGDNENALLVCTDIRREPFLVRVVDAEVVQ